MSTRGRRDPDLATQARGRFGEDEAARWYRRAGYSVLARNWRCEHGEVDLVVGRPGLVVFSEVKARAGGGFGGPQAAVDGRKQLRLRRLATRWLAEHPQHGIEVRFDVVAVVGTRVEVFEGAF